MLPNLFDRGDTPVSRLLKSLPWYTNSEKLEFEKNVVRECYDDQFVFKNDKYGELYVEGIIDTQSLKTLVRVKYLDFYPLFPPKVYPIPARLLSPHINPDFSMCLFYPPDPVDHSWSPLLDTTADILKMAFEWVFKQGFWEMTGKWPGRSAPHGGIGIPIYMQDFYKRIKKKARKKNGRKNRRKLQKPGKGEQLDIK